MGERRTRREFLKGTALVGAAAAAGCVTALDGVEAVADATPAQRPKLPLIRLGDVEVSRLILGSNPFFGFAHRGGTDIGRQMKEYYTEERVMAVMDAAAERGVTAVWTPCYDRWIRLWNRYREAGGKLKTWIGQPDDRPAQMKDAITACAENGGKAVCIQGVRVDEQVRARRFDVLHEWLEHIKSLGLPAGIATHRPETHLLAEEHGLPTDFYHQCLYQPENYGDTCRDQALATIAKLEKPVVAYKVLAAGRLEPGVAFPHVFERLMPKDGICVGVFPKDDAGQIEENAALVRKLSAG